MSVVRTLIGNVKGPKGDTGSQGPQGVAGTIEIGSVQTVSYGSPASVTNSGTEEEAILDFQIPQGAPGEQVTDMRNLVLGAITDSTADYPTFAVNETGSTIFGKIRKFLSDLKANYVSKSMMTTSTNIDTAGQAVADAKAIKALNDSLANLSDSLTPVSHTGYSFVGYSFTDQNLSYVYTVGKICIYSLAFKGGASETTPGHTDTFVTGLPKPLHDSYGNGMSFNGNLTQNFRYRVTSSGSTGIITNYYSSVRVYINNPVIMTGAYIIA